MQGTSPNLLEVRRRLSQGGQQRCFQSVQPRGFVVLPGLLIAVLGALRALVARFIEVRVRNKYHGLD